MSVTRNPSLSLSKCKSWCFVNKILQSLVMYFVFLLNALRHVQEKSPSRAASNCAAVTYTHLETGSRGGEGPILNTMAKNLICIKNSFPGFLTLRIPRHMLGCVSSFFSFLFFFLSQNLDWFAQFLVFFFSYKIFLSHLLQNELHFGDQDAVILCLHKIGQRAELIIPSFPKHHHLNTST